LDELKLQEVKGIVFDCIGTLVKVRVNHDPQLKALYRRLAKAGLKKPYPSFLQAYKKPYQKFFKIRVEELKEISNNFWVAEAVRLLGFPLEAESKPVMEAVEAYFKPYVRSARPASCLPTLLAKLKSRFKLGVVTNFTYAPAMRFMLEKIGVTPYLDVLVISHEVGWRKPHPKIFLTALKGLELNAEETLFIGDDPREDIAGAKGVGMKVALVLRPGDSDKGLIKIGEVKPDYVLESICSLESFNEF
jgi:putative hydrolase of the HAD superfamily